jgi:hypothetical protein
VLAAPVLVSLALGATAASASPSHGGRTPASAPARAGVTWHALGLAHGWKSAQHAYGTGNPSWAVQGGVVYLSGSLRQGAGAFNDVFAVLPSAARPSHALYVSVYTLSGHHANLLIQPSGKMSAYGNSARSFTSLAGVSFPARSLAQHPLALRNGWNSSQFRWNTGDPKYAVRNGVVYLSGSLHQRVGGSEIFAVLPSAARPSHNMYITVYTFNGTTGVLYISTTGSMEAYSGDARSFTSLAGVSFPVGVFITPLVLQNGWQSSDAAYGTGDPLYSVQNGVVYLAGSLNLPSGSNELFGQLPPGARPAHWLYMKVYTNNENVGSLEVRPSGELVIFLDSESELFSSLATISYPLRS